MKRPLLPFCLLLVSVPAFAQTLTSFTPDQDEAIPTYLNAEVVRVAADGTATIRSESGDVTLTADLRGLAGIPSARPGDKLLVAYETVVDDGGYERRIVTYARPASPGSGEPGPSVTVAAAAVPTGSTVRMLSTDPANRTITVTDASGLPVTLPLSSQAAARLSGVSAGDVVGLDFVGGGVVSANALPTVSGVQALPAGTAVGSFVVPPLSGQFVRFDAGTNTLTVQTPNGRQRTFPVSATAGSSLSTLRPGENLSLGFQITQEANRARLRAGASTTTTTTPGVTGFGAAGGSAVLSIGNVQTVAGGMVGAGGSRLQVSPGTGAVTRGAFSNMGVQGAANVVGGVGVANAQAAAGFGPAQGIGGINNTGATAAQAGSPAGIGAGGFSPIGGSPAAAGVPGAGAGVAPMGVGGTFSNMGMGMPFVGTGFATPSVGPGSPYSNNVPSVPAPGTVMSAVLPPATAKAPLTQEDVGMLRAYGERDLDSAAMVLAMVANDIDAAWFRFKMGCLGGFIPETSPGREWFLLLDGRVRTPTDDQCRAMYSQLQGTAAGFEQQLGITLDAARRADVLPGRIREILDRHRIER